MRGQRGLKYSDEIEYAIERYRTANLMTYNEFYEYIGISGRATVANRERTGTITFKQYKNLMSKGVLPTQKERGTQ